MWMFVSMYVSLSGESELELARTRKLVMSKDYIVQLTPQSAFAYKDDVAMRIGSV